MHWIKRLTSRLTGKQAEDLAEQYLRQQGLVTLARNYHCRRGEIDLIMQQHDTLVFVEVKYRYQTNFGQAAEFFDQRKRAKIEAAISHYLHNNNLNPAMLAQRIDVLAIDGQQIKWLKNV